MASKTYQLNITKSDGTNETVSFDIPNATGTYKVKFILSNGQEVEAGNIIVDNTEHSYDLKLTLSDGSTINAGTIVTPIGEGISFESCSWTDIAQFSEAGTASTYFAVGDEKTIELSTGEEITLVILGFDHDDLADGSGKAGMTIGMKNLLAATRLMGAAGTSYWSNSRLRTGILPNILTVFPSDLQSVIKSVIKKYVGGSTSNNISSTNDTLFLFSRVEIDGCTADIYKDEGEQYEYWKIVNDGTINTNRIKYLANGTGSAERWWLRSHFYGAYSEGFYAFNQYGNIQTRFPNEDNGVCVGFCV